MIPNQRVVNEQETYIIRLLFSHANEYVITIVPLFSNSKNNSLQSVFYPAPLHNRVLNVKTVPHLPIMIVFCLLKYEMTPRFKCLLFQTFYSEVDVKQVDVTTTTGSFGILPSHVPTLATLKPGLLTVHDEGGATKYFGQYYRPVLS